MRSKLIGIAITLLCLVTCALDGTRYERVADMTLIALDSLLLAAFSLVKLMAVFRYRHDERKREQVICSNLGVLPRRLERFIHGRIDPVL